MNIEPVGVLLVDSRREELRAMKAILEAPGIELVSARSTTEALQFVGIQKFAAILLSRQMPDMDGFQLATMLRQQLNARTTPLIFLSVGEDEILLHQGYKLAPVDSIKETAPEYLRAKIAIFAELFRKTEDLSEKERIEQQLQDTATHLSESNADLAQFAYVAS
ncbi:MAG: response regulator, partial [Verrucomicrobiaceae bacterium]